VLILAGVIGAVALGLTVLADVAGLLKHAAILPALLFGLMIAYGGVRLGRSVHLVDIADENKRAIYTALSNTIIGVFLLLTSLFSLIANLYGEAVVLSLFAAMSLLSIWPALLLQEAQD
jgi:hypothetical protein